MPVGNRRAPTYSSEVIHGCGQFGPGNGRLGLCTSFRLFIPEMARKYFTFVFIAYLHLFTLVKKRSFSTCYPCSFPATIPRKHHNLLFGKDGNSVAHTHYRASPCGWHTCRTVVRLFPNTHKIFFPGLLLQIFTIHNTSFFP